MEVFRFEWDADNDLENFSKHGITFFEAQGAFADAQRILTEDAAHSREETRYYRLGRIARGILTVRFTLRPGVIRIIGAGFWRKGKVRYERENSLRR